MPNFHTKRSDRSPSIDPEAMTLEMLARRVRLLVEYSLGGYTDQLDASETPLDVEGLVEKIVDTVRNAEKKSRLYSFKRSNKANRDRPPRAFLANVLTHKELERYKNTLITRHRTELDKELLTIWFIQRLLNHTIDHHWHYVAMAMLKILFLYDHEHLSSITSLLQLFEKHDRIPSDDVFRRWKKRTIDDLAIWFGDLVEVTQEKVGPHPEMHFRRPAAPQQNLDLTKKCLGIETLPRETCVLSPGIALKSRADIRHVLEALTSSKSSDAVERILMHLLTCPDAFFTMLTALNINSVGDKCGIPLFSIPGGGNQASVAQARRDIVKDHQVHKTNINKRLQARDHRRRKLTLDHVLIVVDDVIRQSLSTDEPKTISLNLKYGERIIEVRGEDEDGSLPLDLHYVSWSPDLEDGPHTFVTKLKGGRQLKFLVGYERDEVGDLLKALVTVSYTPRTRKRSIVWAAAGVAATALVVAVYSYDSSSVVSRNWVVVSLIAVALPLVLLKTGKHRLSHGLPALLFALIAILFPIPFNWSSAQTQSVGKAHVINDASPMSATVSGDDQARNLPSPTQRDQTEARTVTDQPNTDKEKSNLDQAAVSLGGSDLFSKPLQTSPESTAAAPDRLRNSSASPVGSGSGPISAEGLDSAVKRTIDGHSPLAPTPTWEARAAVENSEVQTPLRNASTKKAYKGKVTLGKNQIIKVSLAKRLSSETAREGDLLETQVVEPIFVGGEVVIPQETKAFARVSKVRTAGERDSIGVQLIMLELNNQTVRIDGELLPECRPQTNLVRDNLAIAAAQRPKVVFVGDKRLGAVIAPAPKTPARNQSVHIGSGFANNSIHFSNRIGVVVEPGSVPATNVCFALKKSVSLVPPREE